MIEIQVNNLVKSFEVGKNVLDGLTFQVDQGERVGLLGRNGAGKTTLFKILTGELDYDEGTVVVGQGRRVGLISQIPVYPAGCTVEDVLRSAFARLESLAEEMRALEARMAAGESDPAILKRYGTLSERFEAFGGYDTDVAVNKIANGLSIPDSQRSQLFDSLSGGEKTRVNLGRLILEDTDILLLDEPTNHLDLHATEWLEEYIRSFHGTVVTISHDRYFLDNVAGWILELDRGRGIPWKGNYSSWLEQKQKRLANEDKTEAQRQKTLQRELEWVRMSPKGRHAKGKARLNAYEAMLSHESERRAPDLEIYIPPGPRLGKSVIELDGVRKSLGDRVLMDGLTAVIPPGAIVGIVGPNGAGKTTLFNMLAGREQPDAGTLRVGESVRFAYVDQGRESLTPGKTVYELISEGRETVTLGGREVNARAYCTRFNFHGADQQKKVDVLSGGERNRLHLARMLKSGANVLLLDEPTNDIDVNTMRALEDALDNFAGCVLVISHDRWFLDRVATHIMAFEDNAEVVFFEGNYTDYEDDRRKRLGKEADTPHRPKFRKLTR